MKMKIEELKDFVVNLYGKESSLLILGPPGIGKSTGVNEASKELALMKDKEFVDYDDSIADNILAKPEKYFVLVDLRLTEVEPADLLGIPKERQGGVSYVPFLWARTLSQSDGILFIDEFTNIQRLDVITAAYKLVLEHRAGFTKFNKNVMVIAAGNSPKESSVSNLLPAPLIDRFTIVETEKPTIEAWTDWMDKNFENWDKRTLGYLRHFNEDFLKTPRDPETLTNFPSPRSWTKLSTLLPQVNEAYWKILSNGRLGPDIGHKFYTFLEREIPKIEYFFSHPKKFTELEEIEQKYLISILVGNYLGKNVKNLQEFKKAIGLLIKMEKEFMILSIISSGPNKHDVVLQLIKENRKLKNYLKEISILRTELEN